MIAEVVAFDPGVWLDRGLALGVAVAVLWWLMKRFDKLDQERIDRAKQHDEQRENNSAVLVSTMAQSMELLSVAVSRFESFEREERDAHRQFAEGLQRVTEAQLKLAEIVADLKTSMNELTRKHDTWTRTAADFVKQLRDIRDQLHLMNQQRAEIQDQRKNMDPPSDF
jgi:predicted RNase H-like nuclease (RuvC/YqgF family)